ncbi:11-beta-hydroxysteroid dehydrogenase A [Arachis duranensis]|uniref:11-beta-hydroxysteroid dehydrogenase A n=1 Tax=Arachis duranensis TaxID=130453 RepID=A0A9C6TSY0_ARADU|nr:11-beta-hydroxysteroid dehydrogenase A [Arachis duranensis]
MAAIQKLLNIALPPLSLVLLSSFMIPFLIFKVFIYVRNLFQTDEKLENKVVLITGAASGIGEVCSTLSAVDCLVNNAGIGKPSGFKDWSNASEFTSIMDVNFWGSVYGTLCAIPHLKTSRGRIVVIASALGWFPLPRFSIYSASKAAIINYFETLRMELGCAIGITIVTPGVVKTDLGVTLIKEERIMDIIPMLSASELAESIVKSACRGDMYLTEPSWVKVLFPFKLLYPPLVDWASRLFFALSPKINNSATELKPE